MLFRSWRKAAECRLLDAEREHKYNRSQIEKLKSENAGLMHRLRTLEEAPRGVTKQELRRVLYALNTKVANEIKDNIDQWVADLTDQLCGGVKPQNYITTTQSVCCPSVLLFGEGEED